MATNIPRILSIHTERETRVSDSGCSVKSCLSPGQICHETLRWLHSLRLPPLSLPAGAKLALRLRRRACVLQLPWLLLHPDPRIPLLRKARESPNSCSSLAVNFTRLLERGMCFPNGQGKLQFGMQLADVGMSHSWTCVLHNKLQSGRDWPIK